MKDKLKPLLWTIVPALLAVGAIWFPFRFSLGAMVEEWDIYYLIQAHPHFWNSFPGQPLADLFAARPLQIFPHFLAHLISDDSFIGLHVVLIAGCILRIVGAAVIGKFLFRSRSYAVAFGLLALVFPADTQQFEFRTVHIMFAVGLSVFAAALTIVAFRSPSKRISWISVIASSVFACCAVLIYESLSLLYLLGLLALVTRLSMAEIRQTIRERWPLIVAWLIAPAINVAYLYYALIVKKSGYQTGISHGDMLGAIKGNFHFLWDSAAYRVFFESWTSTWEIVVTRVVHAKFLAAMCVVITAGLLTLQDRAPRHFPISRALKYVASGLILGSLCYVPFLVSDFFTGNTQRTFTAVLPAATWVIITAIAFVFQRTPMVGSAVCSIFVCLGFVSQIYQFDRYNRDYASIVLPYTSKLADVTDPSKPVHLVFDKTGIAGYLNGMFYSKIQYAAAVRIRKNITPSILCLDDQSIGMLYANCTLAAGNWTVISPGGSTAVFPEKDVQQITMGPDFDPTYRSKSDVWHDFGNYTAEKSLFYHAPASDYICEADATWGYSSFCRGIGWSEGMSYTKGWRRIKFFSATTNTPSLLFNLSPTPADYALKVNVSGLSDITSFEKIAIYVNERKLNLSVQQGHVLVATVANGLLKTGANKIAFVGAIPNGGRTGITITDVRLTPR